MRAFMPRTRDLRGPLSLLMLPPAPGKQIRQRVEEHMFPVGALREHRSQIVCCVNAYGFLLGWDRGLWQLQRAVESISATQFPIAQTRDPRQQRWCRLRDSVSGGDQRVQLGIVKFGERGSDGMQ
jgi:hypothetical protein